MSDFRPTTRSIASVLGGFVSALPTKVDQLSELCRLGLERHDRDSILEAHRQAHGLAGSAATFGYALVSDAARDLERLFKPVSLGQADVASMNRDSIEGAMLALRRITNTVTREGSTIEHDTQAIGPPVNRTNELIYLLDDDRDLLTDWAMQLHRLGYVTREFDTMASLAAALAAEMPVAILADEHLPDGRTSDFLARRRAAGLATPPVFAVSNDGDFETRIAAVRAGVRAFFTKPVDVAGLAERLADVSHPEQTEAPRVLMIDDVQAVAEFHASLLRDAGMQVDVVADPMTLMQHMGAHIPDLILMDMYMPGCTGLELAAVLRQQDAYAGIPIVFLSGEEDLGRQMEALEIGGDDFLTKPVDPRRLVAAVSARIKRARIVRALMTHDSLTGLLNHTSVKEAIHREVAQARRTGLPLSAAVIDVDHFKSVNDRFGHPAGDRVLKTLAQLLQKRLRRSDVIGRYGGEEFIVVLPGTGPQAATQVLDQLRAAFGGVEFYSGEHAFRVTFSAGIAAYPACADSATALIREADRALYVAKADGRDRIVLADT